MGVEDPAFPTAIKTAHGLTKREWVATNLLNGILASGEKVVPPLEEVVKLADKLLEKCAKVPYP